MLFPVTPLAVVAGLGLIARVVLHARAVLLVLEPLARVLAPVFVAHGALSLHAVLKPGACVHTTEAKPHRAVPMALEVTPFALVLRAVGPLHYARALDTALTVLTIVLSTICKPLPAVSVLQVAIVAARVGAAM